MEFQAFVDCVSSPCAVLRVERAAEGHCGEIRILSANRGYRSLMGPGYRDGMLYEELVPKDLKFEDFCFRAAFLGQRMHAYVETKGWDCWTDMLLLPMARESEDVGYCQFTVEFTGAADPQRMATVSAETSAAVIKACITLMGARDFRRALESVMQDLLDISGAYDCRILLIDHKQQSVTNFCEKRSNRAWPIPNPADRTAALPYELVKSWEDCIGVSNEIIVKDEIDMAALEQRNGAWVASMRSYGVSSLMLVPLRRGGALFGYLYIVNFDVQRVVELKELVELMSFFLGSEISNYLLLEQMDEISRNDALTGLRNRNAMARRMRAMSAKKNPSPFGVVNLDLNGLKTVNDTQGHDAGDRLLVEAAEMLTKVFYREDVYRTGGDEFVIIAENIDEEAFLRKVERLRSDMHKHDDVSFALGVHWSDGAEPLASALRLADGSMYADKKAFYQSNPERKRR